MSMFEAPQIASTGSQPLSECAATQRRLSHPQQIGPQSIFFPCFRLAVERQLEQASSRPFESESRLRAGFPLFAPVLQRIAD